MSTHAYYDPSPSKITENIKEKRFLRRMRCQLKVSLKNFNTKREIEAKSFDISRGGIGINIYEKLNVGDKFEVWVHLTDGLKPIHRFGRLTWLKKIDPLYYNAGIRFESAINAFAH